MWNRKVLSVTFMSILFPKHTKLMHMAKCNLTRPMSELQETILVV